MVQLVKHLKGSQEAYESLPKTGGGGVTPDTLYFTTEFSGDTELNTGRIYLGGTLVGKPSVWEELPELYKKVDLGLPSGRLWADRNVGAASPEAYGDYLAWGETTPRGENWSADTPYDWAHYQFNNGATAFNETYFNEHKSEWLDGDVLKPEYDAAHMIMGGSWRMPTPAEMQELLDGTTQTLEELNGISGMRFTSKVNDNSIFMPFAGGRLYSGTSGMGEKGRALSSSPDTVYAGSSHCLDYGHYGEAYANSISHCYGYVVRGVC